ncbi:MAG: riboflavin synthase subunit alpha [Deltaproteobacteria bacterium RIFOXYA12_FULL_58_15]|nr:MAG: riboflavin synthase subunit alpha [Deltaproteobacteria bacterium RIFOXYA12_FULL_58_15]OGR08521.1 MAG: riboflavin synthase subunit alpha [Deltaproteobacteria bacterium RIFOXYB12_FULL_58_9]
MFTGLIETIGTIRQAAGESPRRITVASSIPNEDVAIGDSVAIDGVCQTVVHRDSTGLTFEAATETLRRTTLGSLRVGDKVHLERALRLDGRLDGHLVMGHVDGVGKVTRLEQRQSALYVSVDAPKEVARLTVARGSIAMAGVSLTVTDVSGNVVTVALIPHTLIATRFGELRVGADVNLEADLLARYVERLLEGSETPGSLTEEWLKDKGFA